MNFKATQSLTSLHPRYANEDDLGDDWGKLSSFDKEVIKRIEDIEKLDPDTRQHLFFLIDNVI